MQWFFREFHRWNGALIPHPLDEGVMLRVLMTLSPDMAFGNDGGCFNPPTCGISLYYSTAPKYVWQSLATSHVPMDNEYDLALAIGLIAEAKGVRQGREGASQTKTAVNARLLAYANENGGMRGYPHHGIDARDIPPGACSACNILLHRVD
jgi:hypothetical protein